MDQQVAVVDKSDLVAYDEQLETKIKQLIKSGSNTLSYNKTWQKQGQTGELDQKITLSYKADKSVDSFKATNKRLVKDKEGEVVESLSETISIGNNDGIISSICDWVKEKF